MCEKELRKEREKEIFSHPFLFLIAVHLQYILCNEPLICSKCLRCSSHPESSLAKLSFNNLGLIQCEKLYIQECQMIWLLYADVLV